MRASVVGVAAGLGGALAIALHVAIAAAGVNPLVLVAADSLPFAYLLARRPVLRRLAVRNAVRRPRETALVILGSMLGTAIITGSFVVGDTLDSSIRAGAYTRLGPVDELIAAGDATELAALRVKVASLGPAVIDGTLPIVAAAATAAVGTTRAEPVALLIEVDFAEARALGGDAAATGISGPTPGPGEVVLGRDLARTLGARPGDTVDVYAYGAERSLRVVRILERTGVAGLIDPSSSFGGGSRAPNLFVAPGTVEALARGHATAAAAPTLVLAVSNVGGVLAGATATPRVVPELRRVIGQGPVIRTAKQNIVDSARKQGRRFTELFTSIGFFSVLAGILLLVNIFTSLAEERKVSLGMLRALGLRRSSLVASFSLEGWLYAVGSALLGALVGIGVGRAIILVASGIFASRGGPFALDLRFAVDRSSLTGGFTIGFLISLVTVLLSSLVIARLNVIRAIRDLPEPPRSGRQRLGVRVLGGAIAAVGVATTVSGISSKGALAALLGPGVLLLGLGLVLAGLVPSRIVATVAGNLAVAWGVLCFGLLPDTFAKASVSAFAGQGVLLVAGAIAVLIANLDHIGRVVRVVGGGASAMSLRLGLAYPLARRGRTGASLAMYAMVVFILVFITTLSTLFGAQANQFTRDAAGGFAVRMASNPTNPVPAEQVRAVAGVRRVAELHAASAQFAPDGAPAFKGWPVAGFPQALIDVGPPGLSKWDKAKYPAERDLWQAVLDDSTLLVINEFFLQEGGGGPPQAVPAVGSKVTMRDATSGRTKALTIAAISDGSFVSPYAYASARSTAEVFGAGAVPNLLYVETAPGTDDVRLAAELDGRFLANGASASPFRALVEEGLAQQTSFFRLMQGYIALGLVVGIAGLGVVAVRAVRERRRQIGVLRSLGFQAAQVRRAFLAESGFVALLGVLTGTSLALVVVWRLIGSDAFGNALPFSVPYLQLTVVIALTMVFSLLATIAPAQQASKIRPAVALRMND